LTPHRQDISGGQFVTAKQVSVGPNAGNYKIRRLLDDERRSKASARAEASVRCRGGGSGPIGAEIPLGRDVEDSVGNDGGYCHRIYRSRVQQLFAPSSPENPESSVFGADIDFPVSDNRRGAPHGRAQILDPAALARVGVKTMKIA
jgi:hypothetical protein